MPRFRLAALAAALCATSAWAGSSGFYRQPALRGDQVYLIAEGDLWRVGAQGGDAADVVQAAGRTAPLVVNSSRAVLYASSGADFAARARAVAEATRASLI